MEIVRQLYDLAGAFRCLGYEADTVLLDVNPFYADLPYDYFLYPEFQLPESLRQSRNPLVRIPRGLANRAYRAVNRWQSPAFLNAYDIYIFQYGESLLPENQDFPILKKRGKKIISIFQGSDIRHWSATEPVRESFGIKSYEGYREANSLNQTLRKLRMAERYADLMFFQPSYGELAIRPYMHLYLAMDLTSYPHKVPERDVPVVVHAPSKREIKGTTEILATLERLKSEGVHFTLQLLEGLPNTEVIRKLVDADVVVDELNESHYGMLGLEGMATGCAVAGGNHPGVVPLPKDRPVLHLNPANVYSQLRRLLTEKEFRLQMAHAGRPFVERYHDRLRVAEHMLQCLTAEKRARFDYYPEYFTRHYRLPDGERISENLKSLTGQIIQQWGLPSDVSPEDLVRRELLSDDQVGSSSIPKWNSSVPVAEKELPNHVQASEASRPTPA